MHPGRLWRDVFYRRRSLHLSALRQPAGGHYPGLKLDPESVKRLWRERRMSNLAARSIRRLALPGDAAVHRLSAGFRGDPARGQHAVAAGSAAARYAGVDALVFKHQGYNPTGSFKDNGMTCGASQGLRISECAAWRASPRAIRPPPWRPTPPSPA
jgi:threonine synthase